MSSQQTFIDHPDYQCITGSRLYGTARYNEQGECVSDVDIRGFVVPPLDYLIGIQQFREGSREGDHKVYSLQNFLGLLVKGNAQALECLFAPQSHVMKVTPVGQRILDNRSLFIGKHYYKSITGFSYSEWNKVLGVKQVPVERSLDEKKAIDTFRNAFKHLPKDKWDLILETAYSEHERKVVDAKADVGEKRRAEYGKYGYCATCAHHALRLLYQCEELLLDGHMTFPRPERETLIAVKRGEVPFHEVERLHADIRERVDRAEEKSTIPERANAEVVNSLYRDITRERLVSELA